MKKKLIFEGVATALVTPMKDGRINYTALSEIIEMQIKAGVTALVVGGTTGECQALSDSERFQLYTYVKESVSGRAKVIFGTGTNDTRTAIKHTENAYRIGCDGILSVTPYYNKGTHRGVVMHYKEIARQTPLPIILYNVPTRTGVNLTIEQLRELSEIENIVAIKEASDSMERLALISTMSDSLTLYAGNDIATYSVMALGGKGVISVISNIYPTLTVKLTEHMKRGEYKEALALQKKLTPFMNALFIETNPAPIKYAMQRAGICEGELRLPLYEVCEETRRVLEAEMDKLG